MTVQSCAVCTRAAADHTCVDQHMQHVHAERAQPFASPLLLPVFTRPDLSCCSCCLISSPSALPTPPPTPCTPPGCLLCCILPDTPSVYYHCHLLCPPRLSPSSVQQKTTQPPARTFHNHVHTESWQPTAASLTDTCVVHWCRMRTLCHTHAVVLHPPLGNVQQSTP